MRQHVIPVGLGALLAATAFAGGCASSGSLGADEQAVLATVQAFFDAMEHRDVELARRTLVPEAGYTSVRLRDGRRVVRHGTNEEFIEGLAGRTEQFREWLDGPTVMIEGDVAMVWSPYSFERGGALSHTGIDAIGLVRTDDGWRMAGGVYSVVPVDE